MARGWSRLLFFCVVVAPVAPVACAQTAASGLVSDDCVSVPDAEAQGADLFAFKYVGGAGPDVLYDTHASGGTALSATLTGGSWIIAPNWSLPISGTDGIVAVVTRTGMFNLDSDTFASGGNLDASAVQSVGTIDGIAPAVSATSYGWELSFRLPLQVTPDTVTFCAIAGSPAANIHALIGFDVYRVPATGPEPPLATFRTQGYIGFIDLRTLDMTVPDATGFGCSDLATPDETRVHDADGIGDSGDEVVIFHDTSRTPAGVVRARAPNPAASYWYRVQPVMAGDIGYYRSGGTSGTLRVRVTVTDRDGDGLRESVDIGQDGRYELIDPSGKGLGLTHAGEILSSLSAGLGQPLAVRTDTDGDGILDADEPSYGLDPLVSNLGRDTDSDGVADPLEVEIGSDPRFAETDGGGERDGRELFYGRNPANPCDDVVVTRPLGDVAPAGGDGLVQINDIVKMLRLSVGLDVPTPAQMVLGDIAPSDVADPSVTPAHHVRHGNPDGLGAYPFGRFEHGDGRIDIADVVLDLRQVVGLSIVTD